MIIGGSNKQFVDDESYLYKKGLRVGIDFVKYFSGLLNTKVELIDGYKLQITANTGTILLQEDLK